MARSRHASQHARAFALGAALFVLPSIGHAQTPPQNPPPAPTPTFKVEVIETTPLPGLDLKLEQIPAPVQTAVSADVEASGALELSDFLNRRFTGVFVNEMSGNPFQADLNYRGYTASPVLGTPQGMSIYMDGVRLNQPFGDVVSWDLIPRLAIGSTTLMPGSNPLFGLNTLGGALSIQTKDGRSFPGTTMRAIYGSDVRRAVEFEHGGSRASGLHWYLAGNLFADNGWRDASPSRVGQLFGKVGRHDAKHDTALSVGFADNALNGSALQEQRLLAQDYASVYTKPDETDNRSTFVNLTTRHDRSRTLTLSGNVYYRDIRTKGFNGDINDDSLDQAVYQPTAAEQRALAAAGYTGFPVSGATAADTPFPVWRCIGNVLLKDEPGEKCNALLNRGDSVQRNFGLSGQMTWRDWLAPRNTLTVGAGYDHSRSAFHQSTELGYLNPDRSVTGLNAFADGVAGGNVDGAPFDNRVDLEGRVHTGSVFASDVVAIGDKWNVTVSARYNRTTVRNADRLKPGGGLGSLDGDYVFGRLNPAAGVTFAPSPSMHLYAGYSEGSRAPTSIELGCADPGAPCKLPNALAGDPPLDQVITQTWELGARGGQGALTWNAALFKADNKDDILFVASTQTGFGYFTNFGSTRRQGLELGVNARHGRWSGGAGYTWLDATFESPETVNGIGNSTNDAAAAGGKGLHGTIAIRPGDRIPLIPRHTLKAFADCQVTTRLSFDVNIVAASGVFARGNENNASQPDGTYYLGPGATPAYGIANLGGHFQLTRRVQILAQINNLLDRRYYTAAQLGPTGFTATGQYIARALPAIQGQFPVPQATFYAPGAPAAYWVGTRVKF